MPRAADPERTVQERRDVTDMREASNQRVREANKQRVREAIELVVNRGDADLAAEYYCEDYIQHNPAVAPGLAGLQGLIRAMHASGNPLQAEIRLINAEDDMVWCLLEWSGGPVVEGAPRLRQTAEIFRLRDGRMAEHWDVLQFG